MQSEGIRSLISEVAALCSMASQSRKKLAGSQYEDEGHFNVCLA